MKRFLLLLTLLGAAWAAPVLGGQPEPAELVEAQGPPPPPLRPTMIIVTPGPTLRASKTPGAFGQPTLVVSTKTPGATPDGRLSKPHRLYLPWITR